MIDDAKALEAAWAAYNEIPSLAGACRAYAAAVPLSPEVVERVVKATAPLARMESGAMGEDGWWYDTDEALTAAVMAALTAPKEG